LGGSAACRPRPRSLFCGAVIRRSLQPDGVEPSVSLRNVLAPGVPIRATPRPRPTPLGRRVWGCGHNSSGGPIYAARPSVGTTADLGALPGRTHGPVCIRLSPVSQWELTSPSAGSPKSTLGEGAGKRSVETYPSMASSCSPLRVFANGVRREPCPSTVPSRSEVQRWTLDIRFHHGRRQRRGRLRIEVTRGFLRPPRRRPTRKAHRRWEPDRMGAPASGRPGSPTRSAAAGETSLAAPRAGAGLDRGRILRARWKPVFTNTC